MGKSAKYKGLIMLVLGTTLWGVSGPLIQWFFQKTKLTSIEFLIFRLLFAGLLILFYLLLLKQNILKIWIDKKSRNHLILFSVLGMLGAQYFFIETIKVTNAVTAMLFQFISPLFITVYVTLKHKQFPSVIQCLSIFSVFIGLYLLMTNGSLQNIVFTKKGVFLGIMTALGFTFYTLQPIYLIRTWGPMIVVGWGMLVAGIFTLILNFNFNFLNFFHNLNWFLTLFLILIILSGTLSFLLYIASLEYISSSGVSLLSSIEPLVAIIISAVWLEEYLGGYQMSGAILIVISIVLLTVNESNV